MNHPHSLAEIFAHEVRETIAAFRPPRSTYRLQFRAAEMTFCSAAAIVPYLADLGVSHLYASPYLKAHSGSAHGYDIVDYSLLNPELGSREDFDALVEALHTHGMGQILDFVPNHMGIVATENPWWNNVLENGPGSPYADYFDIDWHPIKAELENKILLPVLGEQYGEALEAGQLQLEYREGAFVFNYFDQSLPLDPRTYPAVLRPGREQLKEILGDDSADLQELESIVTALEYLPERTETAPERIAERQREKEVIKGRLRRLTNNCPVVAEFIERSVRDCNGNVEHANSVDRLDELLNAQAYRLAYWKAASDEINYRRFFDINELAAVCTEEPKVFEAMHRFLFELLVRGDVNGLRIDHIDGLYDPLDYLRRLQRGYVLALGKAAYQRWRDNQDAARRGAEQREPGNELPTWSDVESVFLQNIEDDGAVRRDPLYVVVEKILGPEEPLPEPWPVAGTTGYDFQNLVNRLMVDPVGLADLLKTYHRFADGDMDFREVAYQAKLLILRLAMASDLQLLAHRLNRLSERHRRSRDFTLNALRIALREIVACFPIYRTYIGKEQVSDRDRQFILRAVAQAKRRNPVRDAAVFDFIRDVLLLQQPPRLDDAGRRERDLFVGRFQQVTSPLIAKGIEDTAFYVHVPLSSLNDVGGDPAKGALAPEEFHRENAERLTRRSGSLLATTTHDTKRSEDVRARINVLSEIPRAWRTTLNRWARLNRRHRGEVDGLAAPSRNDEYLLYQTLVGTWPTHDIDKSAHHEFAERIQNYMQKAIHEAKQRTSWISPNPDYDAAMRAFVGGVLDNKPKNRFLADFRAFHKQIINAGLYNALSQALLKLTSPGVPDIYQGQELWDFSLVDPDNRRPVDFSQRREMLAQLQVVASAGDDARLTLARDLAHHPTDPRLKLFVTWQSLCFRRDRADLFRLGSYQSVEAEGTYPAHVVAFAWKWMPTNTETEQMALVVVPRLLMSLTSRCVTESETPTLPLGLAAWAETRLVLSDLPRGPLKNIFTSQILRPEDGRLPLADVLADFPVALMTTAKHF
jgi:(1->4)-alpha-D-glucan 1-alpha-D-glucosylmutase